MNRITKAVLAAKEIGDIICENCNTVFAPDITVHYIRPVRSTVRYLIEMAVEEPIDGMIYVVDHAVIDEMYDCYTLAVLDDEHTSKIWCVYMKP